MNTKTERKRAGAVISVKRVLSDGSGPLARPYLSFKLHGAGLGDGAGVDTPVLDELKFDPQLCDESVRKFAEWHGWEQRLRDAAAKPRDEKTGKSASPAEKFAAIRKLAEHYLSGAKEWNLRTGPSAGAGRAGESLASDKQLLKQALSIYLPTVGKERTAEQIHFSVEKMDKGQISALLAQKEVAEIVLRLREERAVELEIDAEELLEGI